ncbi:MAG: hypothetical protein V1678_03750 [Candidatus Aenigmatarchaeota archaeon]
MNRTNVKSQKTESMEMDRNCEVILDRLSKVCMEPEESILDGKLYGYLRSNREMGHKRFAQTLYQLRKAGLTTVDNELGSGANIVNYGRRHGNPLYISTTEMFRDIFSDNGDFHGKVYDDNGKKIEPLLIKKL